MKIFRSEQIKEIDAYTILHEPITSIDLMERAAGQLFNWITGRFGRTQRIVIFCGPGNNGGDGLALARMLDADRYNTEVFYINFSKNISDDWEINRLRLENETSLKLNTINNSDHFPVISSGDIIIDAIFGSGLTRPVGDLPGEIIKKINSLDVTIISVDIPSGLFGEDNSKNRQGNIVEADFTLSLQFPKLSFMFAENASYVGNWEVLPIGLHNHAIINKITPYSLLEKSDVASIVKTRNNFDHKGTFGHGFMISGSSGKMGAAVLGAKASLRSGIGLLTCHIPSCGNIILQSTIPEAMVEMDKAELLISDIGNTNIFDAVGIGPGIGLETETQQALHKLLSECKKPIVIDADALNILSLNPKWLSLLPAGTILTPHPKEFERIAGKTDNGFNRIELQRNFAIKHNCIVVLKGANSTISTPDGKVMFNSTGNPGMATAGSGDVLTGIILSLLAQGYEPENASVLGVYLHGLAGDIAAGESCYESIIATDIIKNIGFAFNRLRNK